MPSAHLSIPTVYSHWHPFSHIHRYRHSTGCCHARFSLPSAAARRAEEFHEHIGGRARPFSAGNVCHAQLTASNRSFLRPRPAHPSVRCAVRCSSGVPPLGPQVAEKRGTGRQSRRKILVGSSGTHTGSVRSHRVAPSWRSGYLCVSFVLVDCSLQSPDVHGFQVYRDTLYSP